MTKFKATLTRLLEHEEAIARLADELPPAIKEIAKRPATVETMIQGFAAHHEAAHRPNTIDTILFFIAFSYENYRNHQNDFLHN